MNEFSAIDFNVIKDDDVWVILVGSLSAEEDFWRLSAVFDLRLKCLSRNYGK